MTCHAAVLCMIRPNRLSACRSCGPLKRRRAECEGGAEEPHDDQEQEEFSLRELKGHVTDEQFYKNAGQVYDANRTGNPA